MPAIQVPVSLGSIFSLYCVCFNLLDCDIESPKKDDEKYSDQEAHERFVKSLKAAVNIPLKPLMSMTPKRPKKQSKRNKD